MLENEHNKETSLEDIDEIIGEKLYYKTFFKKDADYYEERLEKIKAGQSVYFNPYAFFLGFLWLAYRKMYMEILVLIGAMAAIDCTLYFIFSIDNPSLDRIINIIWAITIGCFANLFYMKKADRIIEKAKTTYNNTSDQLDYIEKAGGVSSIAPVIVIIFFIVIIFGIVIVSDYIESSYSYY